MNVNEITTYSGESIYNVLNGVSSYFGLTWYHIKSGILIYNGSEYWIIKFKKGSGNVRLLLHENHGRQGNTIPLGCKANDLDRETVQAKFHHQNWNDTNLRNALVYIYHHGNARLALDLQRRLLLQQATTA
jgi:hypothetical protein|nr:hypothetical protein [uncultured Lachnoclostridium sp.]